ncbi:sensor histidine kinase [Nocardioides humi]|uniref:histidine kinase n=1 Tax=Nocardioides humi TaxID=449461 RepID=A0ABN2ANX8_9ACTN|nr:histidine kinase [Nocardioides humi]
MRLPARTPVAGGLVVAGVSVALAALATPAHVDALSRVCARGLCDTLEQPSRELLDQVATVGLTAGGWAILVVVAQWARLLAFCALGIVMMLRRPSALATVTGIGLMIVALTDFLPAFDAHGPAKALLVVVAGLNQLSLFLILALFPDGHWHPAFLRRWWILPAVSVSAASVLHEAGSAVPVLDALQTPAILLLVLAQVHRYVRRSDWVARQQAKWVLVGFLALVSLMVVSAVLDVAGLLARFQLVVVAGAHVSFLLIGVGFTFAVLRYRLFDVGVVLWRTFLYGAGTVGVLAAYFALVAFAGMSLPLQTASAVGIAVIAVAVLGGAWLAGRVEERLRRRLYGDANVAAALASSIAAPDGGGGLARVIARSLAIPFVEVRGADGEVVSTAGDEKAGGLVRQDVVDGPTVVGTLLLAPAYGSELDARDLRALDEVMPFVVLVLRAQRETEQLRQARIAAATSREDERRRLRRDLHDGVGPLLASQLVTLDTIRVARERGLPAPQLHASLEEQIRAAIGEIRTLTHDLRPPALDAGGLASALRSESDRAAVAGLVVESRVQLGDGPLPAAVEVNLLRIVREAVTNVVRHANARQVEIQVGVGDGTIELSVTDDGGGRGDAVPGVGTSSMCERAEELGGTLAITPGPGGHGTRVHGRIPL